MNIQTAIQHLVDHHDLSHTAMNQVMQSIMTGQTTSAQIAGFLVALRMKGETTTEITAAAQVMRELSKKVVVEPTHLVDTCGTGGDTSGTFNISTASTFVIATAGGRVAKHGNRSVSSKSGSADVLEAAGVNLAISPDQVAECINELGVGFLFAQKHHSAMKYAIAPRKELKIRTIFNLLGPLTNPANAPYQVLGVFSKDWLRPMAEVLQALGSKHVMVVHADDGLDEISLAAPTRVAELKDDTIIEYSIEPEDFGFCRQSLRYIQVETAEESLQKIHQALSGEESAARDIVALNAGAAIYVCGLEKTLQLGIERALNILNQGAAKQKLIQLVNKTNSF
jgi:anthranilate phosphoribosyltransferase